MVNRLDEEICISVKVKTGKKRREPAAHAHGPGPETGGQPVCLYVTIKQAG